MRGVGGTVEEAEVGVGGVERASKSEVGQLSVEDAGKGDERAAWWMGMIGDERKWSGMFANC